MSRGLISIRLSFALLGAAAALLLVQPTASAQEPTSGKTVADGIYTEAQAIRGAASYDTACSGCHRADMGGANGPALKEDRFAREFADKDLKVLYTKIATTMPRLAPGSLGDSVYLDILAHILRENGFPAGQAELTAESVSGVRVLPGRPKPPPPVGNFSYVETIGCLIPGSDNTWTLANATDPVVIVTPSVVAKLPDDAENRSLGNQSFHLLDAMAYSPESHRGHKMFVRGLLIKLPHEQRMTVSSLEMIAPACK